MTARVKEGGLKTADGEESGQWATVATKRD